MVEHVSVSMSAHLAGLCTDCMLSILIAYVHTVSKALSEICYGALLSLLLCCPARVPVLDTT